MSNVSICVEYNHSACIQNVVNIIKKNKIRLHRLEVIRIIEQNGSQCYRAVLHIQIIKRSRWADIAGQIAALEDVKVIE